MTMKLRNRLIALVCLIIFLGLGAALFLSNSSRKPFAVILFVSDNITPASLTATRLFSGGGDARLQLEELPNAALCRNAANDFSVPESSSASTAIAAGKRVNRGSLCIDPAGTKLPSLLEIAFSKGRSTGLITTGSLTAATAAAFYAKSINAEDQSDLASQFSHHQPFDFVIGGDLEKDVTNATNALPVQHYSRSPLEPVDTNSFTLVRTVAEMGNQPFWNTTPVLGLLPAHQFTLTPSGEGDPNAPSLSDLVRLAIRHLQANRNGYLLVVDDPSIGKAAGANDAETMFQRILAFDQAVATARRYAGNQSLIIVAGRETIGGLQLNGYPFLADKGVSLLSINAQGNPSLCWATGPGFSMESPNGDQSKKGKSATLGILSQPSACPLPQGIGVAGDVLTLGVGQGSEKLKGFLDLTDIHDIILDKL
jgi:alkaline phosphatase